MPIRPESTTPEISDQPSMFPACEPSSLRQTPLRSIGGPGARRLSAVPAVPGTVGDLPGNRPAGDHAIAGGTVPNSNPNRLTCPDPMQGSLFPEIDAPMTSAPVDEESAVEEAAATDVSRGADADTPSVPVEPRADAPRARTRPAYPRNTIIRIPLAEIDPALCPWHLRRDPEPPGIDDLLDAIRMDGVLDALHLTEDGGRLLIVSGMRRYHAAMRRRAEGGPDYIEAIILAETDPANLLRRTLREALTGKPPSYLEIGWGLVRLWQMLGHPADEVSQVGLMNHLRLAPEAWKGRMNDYVRMADAMPEGAATDAAATHGCRVRDIADQSRELLRRIKSADPRTRPIVMDVLAESAAREVDAAPAVRQVISAASDPEVLERLESAVASGEGASSVLATLLAESVKDAIESGPAPVRGRVRALASAIVRWCRGILRRATERLRTAGRRVLGRSQLLSDTD